MYIPRPIRVRPREENILNTKKLQMENIMGFTEYTRQLLIALGMVWTRQGITECCCTITTMNC